MSLSPHQARIDTKSFYFEMPRTNRDSCTAVLKIDWFRRHPPFKQLTTTFLDDGTGTANPYTQDPPTRTKRTVLPHAQVTAVLESK